MRLTRTLIFGALTAGVPACAGNSGAPKASQTADSSRTQLTIAPKASALSVRKPIVRLVDFAVHGVMADEVARIEVTTDGAADTIPGVFTSLQPIATDDGMIHGIAMTAGGEAKNGYDYDPRARKLTLFSLPSDVNGFFHEIELSPDAKFVAYVAHVQSGDTWAVVRAWPSMTLVARTPPSQGYPSDVGYDKVAWQAPDRFHISYRISTGPSVVVEGNPRSGSMTVDTVAKPQT